MYTQALKYLNEEMMANIAMIEAIHRDNAEILSAERGAVLLREKNSGAYMLYAKEFEPGEVLLRLLLEREDLPGAERDPGRPLPQSGRTAGSPAGL